MGCGIGGTSRYLAKTHDCRVTGVTISGKQVQLARKLTMDDKSTTDEASVDGTNKVAEEPIELGHGSVRFIELDAERLDAYFPVKDSFDCVWISEAMSHLPDKKLFFQNAVKLLCQNGRLVVADWFRAEDLTDMQLEADIKPIEGVLYQCLMSEFLIG